LRVRPPQSRAPPAAQAAVRSAPPKAASSRIRSRRGTRPLRCGLSSPPPGAGLGGALVLLIPFIYLHINKGGGGQRIPAVKCRGGRRISSIAETTRDYPQPWPLLAPAPQSQRPLPPTFPADRALSVRFARPGAPSPRESRRWAMIRVTDDADGEGQSVGTGPGSRLPFGASRVRRNRPAVCA